MTPLYLQQDFEKLGLSCSAMTCNQLSFGSDVSRSQPRTFPEMAGSVVVSFRSHLHSQPLYHARARGLKLLIEVCGDQGPVSSSHTIPPTVVAHVWKILQTHS